MCPHGTPKPSPRQPSGTATPIGALPSGLVTPTPSPCKPSGTATPIAALPSGPRTPVPICPSTPRPSPTSQCPASPGGADEEVEAPAGKQSCLDGEPLEALPMPTCALDVLRLTDGERAPINSRTHRAAYMRFTRCAQSPAHASRPCAAMEWGSPLPERFVPRVAGDGGGHEPSVGDPQTSAGNAAARQNRVGVAHTRGFAEALRRCRLRG